MNLTNEITPAQYARFKKMSVNEIALHEMGELSTESVQLAIRWFNRCRAVENKVASENRSRNLKSIKREPKWLGAAMERAEVAHYEG